MKKVILFFFMITVFTGGGWAQDDSLLLIDEFGRLTDDDRLARLDNFSIGLREHPDKTGLVRVSGGRSFSPSGSYLFGAIARAFLLNHAKFDPSRFEIQNCDVTGAELITKLYIVSSTAIKPPCDTTLPVFEKTTLFGTLYAGTTEGCCDIIGGTESILEAFSGTLAKLLEKNPGSKVSIIGYAGTNVYRENEKPRKTRWVAKKPRRWDMPAASARMLRKVEGFFREKNIDTSRIGKIYAGYKESAEVEFWFIPAGDKAPKPNPDYRVGKRLKRKR